MTLHTAACTEKCEHFCSFGEVFFKRCKRDFRIRTSLMEPWRNTCCKHGRRPEMVVLSVDVPPRARCEFWYVCCIFWKRHHQKRTRRLHFYAEATLCRSMLYWKLSTNDDTSNSYSSESDSDMTHPYLTWLIHIWHDSIVCDVTHSNLKWLNHMWHDTFMSDMTHWRIHTRHDSFKHDAFTSCELEFYNFHIGTKFLQDAALF